MDQEAPLLEARRRFVEAQAALALHEAQKPTAGNDLLQETAWHFMARQLQAHHRGASIVWGERSARAAEALQRLIVAGAHDDPDGVAAAEQVLRELAGQPVPPMTLAETVRQALHVEGGEDT